MNEWRKEGRNEWVSHMCDVCLLQTWCHILLHIGDTFCFTLRIQENSPVCTSAVAVMLLYDIVLMSQFMTCRRQDVNQDRIHWRRPCQLWYLQGREGRAPMESLQKASANWWYVPTYSSLFACASTLQYYPDIAIILEPCHQTRACILRYYRIIIVWQMTSCQISMWWTACNSMWSLVTLFSHCRKHRINTLIAIDTSWLNCYRAWVHGSCGHQCGFSGQSYPGYEGRSICIKVGKSKGLQNLRGDAGKPGEDSLSLRLSGTQQGIQILQLKWDRVCMHGRKMDWNAVERVQMPITAWPTDQSCKPGMQSRWSRILLAYRTAFHLVHQHVSSHWNI